MRNEMGMNVESRLNERDWAACNLTRFEERCCNNSLLENACMVASGHRWIETLAELCWHFTLPATLQFLAAHVVQPSTRLPVGPSGEPMNELRAQRLTYRHTFPARTSSRVNAALTRVYNAWLHTWLYYVNGCAKTLSANHARIVKSFGQLLLYSPRTPQRALFDVRLRCPSLT